MDDVDYEPLFRAYKLWLPYELLASSLNLEVEVISNKADSTMLFKPPTRSHTVEKRALVNNVGLNFKVMEGIYIEGATQPAVADVQVLV